MMKISLRSVAILAALAVTCCVSAMAEKQKPKPPFDRTSPIVRVPLTEDEKVQRMKEIVDVNTPGPDPSKASPEQFPAELRLLTLLTLDINFNDLFGSNGKSITQTVRDMRENWRIYKTRLANTDPYFRSLPFYTHTERYLARIGQAIRTSHGTVKWRDLYTKDLKYSRGGGSIEPNPSNKDLFENLELLSMNGVGGGASFPMFPFLTLDNITDVDDNGNRVAVDALLSDSWLATVGHLTYYDLFTKSYLDTDVTEAIDCAVQRALGNEKAYRGCGEAPALEILRIRGARIKTPVKEWLPIVRMASGGGVDCCCQNPSPDGKKKCFGTPDLGCTNTGNPARCSLGSIACPAGTLCP